MVVPNVAESSSVCISYSITKLQYNLTARKIAVRSCDLSESPANKSDGKPFQGAELSVENGFSMENDSMQENQC